MLKTLKITAIALGLFISGLTGALHCLKDLTSIAGVRSNQLVGYGIVVGLAGSGDGGNGLTKQSLQSMVSQFGLVTDVANITAANAAAVMVTAEMPAFVKTGQRLDVTISAIAAQSHFEEAPC